MRCAFMSAKKLPDAEFEIMKAIWHTQEPVTSPQLTEQLGESLPDKDWKQQTVLTMLVRLENKGFLRSEKSGRERYYYTVISESQYMKVERDNFIRRFSGSSFSGLVKALYDGGEVSDEEIAELKNWLNSI